MRRSVILALVAASLLAVLAAAPTQAASAAPPARFKPSSLARPRTDEIVQPVVPPKDPNFKEAPAEEIRKALPVDAIIDTISTTTPITTPALPLVNDPLAEIMKAASVGTCYNIKFPSRGKPPMSYLRGLALTFGKALCNTVVTPRADWVYATQPPTKSSEDILNHYAAQFKRAQMTGDAPDEILRYIFTLLLGLGMRESSGNFCEGRDMSAKFIESHSAEAGLYQCSWGSRYGMYPSKTGKLTAQKHPIGGEHLENLHYSYQKNSVGCFKSVFSERMEAGCKGNNRRNWPLGASDEGTRWQDKSKMCPAFAVEWAFFLTRVKAGKKGEWGPLRTGAAEIYPQCELIFKKVQEIVMANPGAICPRLNGAP